MLNRIEFFAVCLLTAVVHPAFGAELPPGEKRGTPNAAVVTEEDATQRESQAADSRETSLTQWASEREEAIAKHNRQIEEHKKEIAATTKRLENIERSKRPTARSRTTSEQLEQRCEELKRAIRGAEVALKKTDADFEQRRRRILKTHPRFGDPEYVEYRGRLHTRKELAEVKAFEAEHGSPQAAANRYMEGLITRGVVNKAALQSVTFNGQRVNYQVEYTSPAGFVMTRNGYVVMTRDAEGYWYVDLIIMAATPVAFDGQ